MRWGWKRLLDKGILRGGALKVKQKNINNNELSFRLAQVILRKQAELAGYLNAKASKISGSRMRMMLICFVLIIGAYCLYLICGSLTFLIK